MIYTMVTNPATTAPTTSSPPGAGGGATAARDTAPRSQKIMGDRGGKNGKFVQPIPQIDSPHFVHGEQDDGVARGKVKEGQVDQDDGEDDGGGDAEVGAGDREVRPADDAVGEDRPGDHFGSTRRLAICSPRSSSSASKIPVMVALKAKVT